MISVLCRTGDISSIWYMSSAYGCLERHPKREAKGKIIVGHAPFGLFGRDCLTQNNSIISYNVLNQEASTAYTTDDYSQLTIQAKYVIGNRSADYWKYEIKIKMKDGKSFAFSNRDFDWRKPHYQDTCLNQMLAVKAFFPPDMITIEGGHNLEKVADFLGLNDEQNQLLQELFR